MREALEEFGGELDVLVNNVGTNIRKPTVPRARCLCLCPSLSPSLCSPSHLLCLTRSRSRSLLLCRSPLL